MASTASVTARRRHLHYGRFVRLRRSKRTLAFLATQATRLTASATGQTITITTPGVAATQTLTGTGVIVVNGDTVTIGTKVYTFQSALTNVDGNVKIGGTAAASLTNLFNAINGTGGVSGTDYAAATVAHPTVTATNPTGTTVVLTAKTQGVAGNAIASTETSAQLSFGAATLTGGVDATSAVGATTHGISSGEGPYVITAATTLPGGYTAGRFVWVRSVDANNVTLHPTRADAIKNTLGLTYSSAGVGALTLKKALTNSAMFELLRRNTTEAVAAIADIDNLS